MRRPKHAPRKFGEMAIGYEMKRNAGKKGYINFTLSEKIDDAVSAKVAQFEYQCMGHYCHAVPMFEERYWHIWISNRKGRRMPRLLEGEVVTRRKGRISKLRAS